MVLMLAGEVVLIEDSDSTLRVGDVACWAAGRAVGHCLENRSTAEARYLVIGTRRQNDTFHYPDHDLITHKTGPDRTHFHANGRPRRC